MAKKKTPQKSSKARQAKNNDLSNELLIIGAEKGSIRTVKQALMDGADIHENDELALRWAARGGYTAIVKLLLDRGADIHAHDDDALRCTAICGKTETAALLLDRGADIHAPGNNFGLDMIEIAVGNGHPETAALLKDWAAGKRPDSLPKQKAAEAKKETLHQPKDTAEEQERESNLAKQLEELKAAKIRARELGFTRPTNLGRTPGKER